MTKKHFVDMATEFGQLYRDADFEFGRGRDSYDTSKAKLEVLEQSMLAFCGVAKRANRSFDKMHFLEFVQEIRRGERDLEGRKVK